MASLLQRMNVSTNGGAGPVRSKFAEKNKASPYNRPGPRPDTDTQWTHDMYDTHNSLSARMNINPGAPKANLNHGIVGRAIQAVASSSDTPLSIRGASAASQGNVVEVKNLAAGTTADDVVAIFKRCGEILKASSLPGKELAIRITFKTPSAAQAAVKKFDKQTADGKMLSVTVVGSVSTSLGGRLGGTDGLGLVRQEGSVDILMESANDTGSKMRSDSLLNERAAQVLVAPPGANPAEYTQGNSGRGSWKRGGTGRGRGNRRGAGKRGGNGGRMDVD